MRSRLIDLRPLRGSTPYRWTWAGLSLSGLGLQVTLVAVLFQVWQLTQSPVWTGVVGLTAGVPKLVISLLGGALADAVDRRSLVRWTSLGGVAASLALAAQALAGADSLALVLALVFVQASCGALGAPAWRAIPPRLLRRDLVPAAIALQHVSFQLAMLVGPALAGLIIGRAGLGAAYLVHSAMSLVVLVAAFRLPPLPAAADNAGPGLAAIRDGLAHVARRPLLRGSFLTDAIATLLAMPIALFPLINEARFGGRPETLGLFLSAVAVGGLVAGLASGAVTRGRRLGAIQLVAAGVWGAALAALGLVGPLWAALLALAVAGAADTVAVIARAAMVEMVTPDSYRGRVTSVEGAIGIGGPELGNFRAGVVAGLTSGPFALVSGGLLCVVGVAWVAARNRELREFDLADVVEVSDARR